MKTMEQIKADPVYQKLMEINDTNPWMVFANATLNGDQNVYVALGAFYLQNEVENRKDYEAAKYLDRKMGPTMHVHMGMGSLARAFVKMSQDLNLSAEEMEPLLDGLMDTFKVNVKATYDTLT